MAMGDWCIGVLGGSGLYDIPNSKTRNGSRSIRRGVRHRTKFASGASPDASSPSFLGMAAAIGSSPGHLNYRANIDALKRAGATDIVARLGRGSLREELAPGAFVAVDQFIDHTRGRESSFFGEGIVAHVSMAEPVCPRLTGMAPRRRLAPVPA